MGLEYVFRADWAAPFQCETRMADFMTTSVVIVEIATHVLCTRS